MEKEKEHRHNRTRSKSPPNLKSSKGRDKDKRDQKGFVGNYVFIPPESLYIYVQFFNIIEANKKPEEPFTAVAPLNSGPSERYGHSAVYEETGGGKNY